MEQSLGPVNAVSATPELRSRRAAFTEDAALIGGFGVMTAYTLSAAIARSGLETPHWAALGLGLGVVLAWPGPGQNRLARILFSAALVTMPLLTAPVHLGLLLHVGVLEDLTLNAPQLTGVLGAGLLGLGLWSKQKMGRGMWRRQHALRELGRELPGWQILRSLRTGPWDRVLSGPDGNLITLHVASGHERGRGVRRVTWPEPTEDQLARRVWPGSSVLWVTLPTHRPAVTYVQEHWDGGLTWPATTTEISTLLWSSCAQPRPEPPQRMRAGRAAWLRQERPPRPPTPAQVRAAGLQVWVDIPGLFNVPGALSCRPQPYDGLPSGVFSFAQAGQNHTVRVGVWPHPDPPFPEHPDQRAVTGLWALLDDHPDAVVWAPLLDVQDGSADPQCQNWVIGGVPAITSVLEDRLRPTARQEGQRTRTNTHPEPDPGENAVSDLGGVDPYRVLGVSRSASADEIRKAWRSLVLIWHPDRTQRLAPAERKAAEAHFRTINAAYDTLKHNNQGA